MNDFINFFIKPYINSSTINITLEFIAVFFGIISVLLAQRVLSQFFITGIINSSIYVYITFNASLYGEFIINICYICMSLYGWYKWNTENHSNKYLGIKFSNKKDYIHTFILWIFVILFIISVYYFLGRIYSISTWIDILITPIFFCGMYQMSLKRVENWLFWIVGNIISIPLYFIKGLPITSIQFFIFTFFSFKSYFIWKKIAKNNKKI